MEILRKRQKTLPRRTWLRNYYEYLSSSKFFTGRTIRLRERTSPTKRTRGALQRGSIKLRGWAIMYSIARSIWNFRYMGWRTRLARWWLSRLLETDSGRSREPLYRPSSFSYGQKFPERAAVRRRKTEKTTIQGRPTRKTSKVMMVTPLAPEQTWIDKW